MKNKIEYCNYITVYILYFTPILILYVKTNYYNRNIDRKFVCKVNIDHKKIIYTTFYRYLGICANCSTKYSLNGNFTLPLHITRA